MKTIWSRTPGRTLSIRKLLKSESGLLTNRLPLNRSGYATGLIFKFDLKHVIAKIISKMRYIVIFLGGAKLQQEDMHILQHPKKVSR